MTTPARIPGKYGRLPRDHSRYALAFEDYLTEGLPDPPHPDVDRCSLVSDWHVYLNSTIGDCTIAGILHCTAAMAVYAGHPMPVFADSEVLKAYSAVSGYDPATGANDNGATLQAVLEYGRQTGFTDETGKVHKVAGYAALRNPSDQDLLARCLWTFGAVYAGGQLPQSAEQEFPGLWTYVPGSPIAGGHCTAFQRRSFGGIGTNWYVSWGQPGRATRGFTWLYLDASQGGEAWVLATEDWIAANGTSPAGLDLSQLLADMSQVS